MNLAGFQVEPERFGLDDFLKAQAGMEAAKEDEFQVFPLTLGEKRVSELWRAEVQSGTAGDAGQLDLADWIFANGFAGMDGPLKERPQDCQITVDRSEAADAFLFLVFAPIRLRQGALPVRHHGDADAVQLDVANVIREKPENGALAVDACHGVFIALPLVGQEAANLGAQPIPGDGRIVPNLCCSADRLREIVRFQRKESAHPVALNGEVIQPAAPVDAGEILHSPATLSQAPSHRQLLQRSNAEQGRLVSSCASDCAVGGSNARPLPCQGSDPKRDCHTPAVTPGTFARTGKRVRKDGIPRRQTKGGSVISYATPAQRLPAAGRGLFCGDAVAIYPQAQCNSGTTQSRPFPARAVKGRQVRATYTTRKGGPAPRKAQERTGMICSAAKYPVPLAYPAIRKEREAYRPASSLNDERKPCCSSALKPDNRKSANAGALQSFSNAEVAA